MQGFSFLLSSIIYFLHFNVAGYAPNGMIADGGGIH